MFRTLRDIGYRGMLSLELFNPEYYKRDAFEVVKTGLDKTQGGGQGGVRLTRCGFAHARNMTTT